MSVRTDRHVFHLMTEDDDDLVANVSEAMNELITNQKIFVTSLLPLTIFGPEIFFLAKLPMPYIK